MNKPTRLRTILVEHIKGISPDADYTKINALEEDIKTFVKSIWAVKSAGYAKV